MLLAAHVEKVQAVGGLGAHAQLVQQSVKVRWQYLKEVLTDVRVWRHAWSKSLSRLRSVAEFLLRMSEVAAEQVDC